MKRGAVPRRSDRRGDLQFDGSDVTARTEGTAQAALIDGEVRAAESEATGGIAGFEGRTGRERKVCQCRAAVDVERGESSRHSGEVGGDEARATIGVANQVVAV